jgi:hypothetical protein
MFSCSIGSILYHCIYGCMFCMLLFNFVNYIFLLLWYVFLLLCLCILNVRYVQFWVFCLIVLFCVLFFCKCVLYYCYWVSTQLQLTNISHPIITIPLCTNIYTVSWTIWTFELRVSVHRGLMNKIPTRCNKSRLFSLCFLLYMFRVLHSPIIRSLNCTSRYGITV